MKWRTILYTLAVLLDILPYGSSINVGEVFVRGNIFDQIGLTISCGICKLVVGIFYIAAKRNEPLPLLKLQFIPLCRAVHNSVVCNGIFDSFAPEIIEAFKQVEIGPKEICSMLSEDCPQSYIPTHEWTITLPNVPKPPLQERGTPKVNQAIKVLQINDIHLDLEYAVGSTSNCQEPLCCRNFSSDKILTSRIPAGRWASIGCDTPPKTLDYILETIAKQHTDITYIMWLGDIVPHDLWRQTKPGQLIVHREAISTLKRFFPTTLILPTIGNHETEPDGCYPPPWVTDPNFSVTWLSEEVTELWKDWVPPSQHENVKHGGYYSMQPRPGLTVVSLNTIYCHCRNWWLYVNSTDPSEQLQWLVNQLQQAEDNGGKVHIIGHIPPGDKDCLRVWSKNYYEIVNRYENTITAQFFGHTHFDEFEVFYDTHNLSRPVNVAFIGPSITPFDGVNPSYRIYYIDGAKSDSTWEVVDYETWIMQLDKANKDLQHSPPLSKLYSAKESYSLEELRPKDWSNLIYRMKGDDPLFDRFYRNYYTGNANRPSYKVKDKFRILCNLKSGKSRASIELCGDLGIQEAYEV